MTLIMFFIRISVLLDKYLSIVLYKNLSLKRINTFLSTKNKSLTGKNTINYCCYIIFALKAYNMKIIFFVNISGLFTLFNRTFDAYI